MKTFMLTVAAGMGVLWAGGCDNRGKVIMPSKPTPRPTDLRPAAARNGGPAPDASKAAPPNSAESAKQKPAEPKAAGASSEKNPTAVGAKGLDPKEKPTAPPAAPKNN